LTPTGLTLHARFVSAIDDDLDMPVALALLREILRAPVDDNERRWLILDSDAVLALELDRVWDTPSDALDGVPDDVTALATTRATARAAREWARADDVRAEIEALGWDVTDTSDGPRLTRRRPSPAE
jgi:cysteinyl-tRNA synthetase